MTKQTSAVALQSDKGDSTPLSMPNPFALSDDQVAAARAEIEAAKTADESKFQDITPIYWEAKRGEQIVATFLGWKQILKIDEKTAEEEQRFMAVFFDGNRQIVAGQIALVEAMYGRPLNKVYHITCDEAVAGKAKKFTVKEFNG